MNPIEHAKLMKQRYENIFPLVKEMGYMESLDMRLKFLHQFINVTHSYFNDYVLSTSDNIRILLWDMLRPDLREIAIVPDRSRIADLADHLGNVLLQWDCGLLPIGKERVFTIPFEKLLSNLEYFPEDLYIFNDSLDWLIIHSHELFDYSDSSSKWLIVDPSKLLP